MASADIARERSDRWRVAAFIGWQASAASGSLKKGMTFGKYLREMGLQDDTKPVAGSSARGKANAARVREAFKKKREEPS